MNIFKILFVDLQNLTNYGFGYLTGKIIMFLLLLAIALLTRKSVFPKA